MRHLAPSALQQLFPGGQRHISREPGTPDLRHLVCSHPVYAAAYTRYTQGRK
jgi:hypothetical protein